MSNIRRNTLPGARPVTTVNRATGMTPVPLHRMAVPTLADVQDGDIPADNSTGDPGTPTGSILDDARDKATEGNDVEDEHEKVKEGKIADCMLFGDC